MYTHTHTLSNRQWIITNTHTTMMISLLLALPLMTSAVPAGLRFKRAQWNFKPSVQAPSKSGGTCPEAATCSDAGALGVLENGLQIVGWDPNTGAAQTVIGWTNAGLDANKGLDAIKNSGCPADECWCTTHLSNEASCSDSGVSKNCCNTNCLDRNVPDMCSNKAECFGNGWFCGLKPVANWPMGFDTDCKNMGGNPADCSQGVLGADKSQGVVIGNGPPAYMGGPGTATPGVIVGWFGKELSSDNAVSAATAAGCAADECWCTTHLSNRWSCSAQDSEHCCNSDCLGRNAANMCSPASECFGNGWFCGIKPMTWPMAA